MPTKEAAPMSNAAVNAVLHITSAVTTVLARVFILGYPKRREVVNNRIVRSPNTIAEGPDDVAPCCARDGRATGAQVRAADAADRNLGAGTVLARQVIS